MGQVRKATEMPTKVSQPYRAYMYYIIQASVCRWLRHAHDFKANIEHTKRDLPLKRSVPIDSILAATTTTEATTRDDDDDDAEGRIESMLQQRSMQI